MTTWIARGARTTAISVDSEGRYKYRVIMNPLSIFDNASSWFDRTVIRGIMHVFNACSPRNPVATYEEYRCVDWRSVSTEGMYDLAEGVGEAAAEGSRGA